MRKFYQLQCSIFESFSSSSCPLLSLSPPFLFSYSVLSFILLSETHLFFLLDSPHSLLISLLPAPGEHAARGGCCGGSECASSSGNGSLCPPYCVPQTRLGPTTNILQPIGMKTASIMVVSNGCPLSHLPALFNNFGAIIIVAIIN